MGIMKSRFSFCLLSVMAIISVQGCSSSQTNESLPMDASGMESGADAVGSIPEDMLAQEDLPMSSETTATENNAEPAAALPQQDPFADLKDEEGEADAMAVVEENSPKSDETLDFYTVKSGDTLMKIAFSIYGDIDRWKELFDWNRASLKKASQLRVGMKLKYEVPSQAFELRALEHSYTIKNGDTLAAIADEVYGRKMKYRKLHNFNKSLIKNPNRIFAGFTIFYDITAEEVAEAEARRKERLASGGSPTSGGAAIPENPTGSVPSVISPPAEAPPSGQPIAISPPAQTVPTPEGSVIPAPPTGN